MFDNVGGKIKTMAEVVTWIGIIASVIIGLMMFADEDTVLIGILVMVLGSFLSWLSSLLTYGFGQLVENSDKLVKAQCNCNITETASKEVVVDDKLETLKKWKEDGLISEEEYNEKINQM